jgi:TonB family protein
VQAALPPWVAGPAALGSPVPWAAPAALTILFGVTGGMRVMAMMVGFFALRRLFRAGPGAFTRVTAMWVVGLLLLWYVVAGLAGVVGGLSATGTPDTYVTAPPSAVPPYVERPDAYRLAEVERLPSLANQVDVDEALAAAIASAPWPHSRLQGSVLLHFVVNQEGNVDPRTVTLINSPNPEAGSIALDVAAVLRFRPALKDGAPVPVWMDYTITLPNQL